ncbi:DUF4411 family protein [Poritiphilus flavus]|uniref:DUF4411 family protein n=1 Tax=Poritiphilus flavus TaxID=2697053 RepID=A0A6L9EIE7_9FLAO|nr:DUF4411 family protein [Poritiphilus flavus]NAS14435.1 DUF4411 family protein [Poritiphilus flavus]
MIERGYPLYCLDANVLIQAWQKYYSPEISPSYWDTLNDLGRRGIIFVPSAVKDEIEKGEDDLYLWLKSSSIPIRQIDGQVTKCLKDIYAANPTHKYLVSSNGIHSLADPWVIAHAINENAVVVTKEIKDVYKKPTKIKIPHVCDNMKIKWINDFDFIKEVNIRFNCELK